MAPRFLAFLLFGMLTLVAFDSFETQGERRENAAPSATSGIDDSSQVTAMDGGNPYPPVKKAF